MIIVCTIVKGLPLRTPSRMLSVAVMRDPLLEVIAAMVRFEPVRCDDVDAPPARSEDVETATPLDEDAVKAG